MKRESAYSEPTPCWRKGPLSTHKITEQINKCARFKDAKENVQSVYIRLEKGFKEIVNLCSGSSCMRP